MLSRFIWNLIQPHLSKVLAQHDAAMIQAVINIDEQTRNWIKTEGCEQIEKAITQAYKKHIELEDKTSAELYRLEQMIIDLREVHNNQTTRTQDRLGLINSTLAEIQLSLRK